MKDIEFGWVRAGDSNGAHGVVGTNLPDNLASEVARRTDFPGNLPSEIGKSGIVAIGCFELDKKFVVYEIGRDHQASRAGMASSGSILIDVSEATELCDLKAVIVNAREVRQKGDLVSPSFKPEYADLPPCPLLVHKLAQGRVFLPVDCDQQLVLSALWCVLPRSLRSSLRARLCFSADDFLGDSGIRLGFVPRQLRWAFPNNEWLEDPFVNNLDSDGTDVFTQLGLGGAKDTTSFVDEHRITLHSLADLALAERVRTSVGSNKPSDMVSALRYSRSLSGGTQKQVLDERLVETIANDCHRWRYTDIQSLRNIDLNENSNADLLETAISEWVVDELPRLCENDLSVLLPGAFDERCQLWWRQAMRRGFREYCGLLPTGVAESIWQMARSDTAAAKEWLREFKQTEKQDNTLALSLPPVDLLSVENVLAVVGPGNFPETTAQAFVLADGVGGAVDRIDNLASAQERISVMEVVCSNASAQDIVMLAGYEDRDGLDSEVANRMIASPEIIEQVDICAVDVQRKIAIALHRLPSDANGQITKLVERVFRLLTRGGSVKEDLVIGLSKLEVANAYSFSDRSSLWAVLPAEARTPIIHRTAETWLRRISRGSAVETPEPELSVALSVSLLSTVRLGALDQVDDIAGWVQLAKIEPAVDSNNKFLKCLLDIVQADHDLNGDVVAGLGVLVNEKNLKTIAKGLVKSCHDRKDFGPAWAHIRPMLSFWDKLRLPSSTIVSAEADEVLAELLAELYYSGPSSDLIWERAGGDLSDIVVSGQSGTEQWRQAIRKVTHGNKVKRRALLSVALDDHPNNSELKQFFERCDE